MDDTGSRTNLEELLVRLGSQDMITGSTAHTYSLSQNRDSPALYSLVLTWPVGRKQGDRVAIGKSEMLVCGCGKRKRVEKEPHETKKMEHRKHGGQTDREPAARCVGWCEHMACIG